MRPRKGGLCWGGGRGVMKSSGCSMEPSWNPRSFLPSLHWHTLTSVLKRQTWMSTRNPRHSHEKPILKDELCYPPFSLLSFVPELQPHLTLPFHTLPLHSVDTHTDNNSITPTTTLTYIYRLDSSSWNSPPSANTALMPLAHSWV